MTKRLLTHCHVLVISFKTKLFPEITKQEQRNCMRGQLALYNITIPRKAELKAKFRNAFSADEYCEIDLFESLT